MKHLEHTVQALQERIQIMEQEKKSVALLEKRIQQLEQQQKLAVSGDNATYSDKAVDRSSFIYLMAENVTAIVGLREFVVGSNWFIKVSWLMLFFMGAGATAYYVAKSCLEYSTNPVATTVSVGRSDSFEFPSFKLCVNTWVDPEKAAAMDLSHDALLYSLGYLNSFDLPYFENVTEAEQEFGAFYKQNNFTDLSAYYLSIAYDAEQLNLTQWLAREKTQTANNTRKMVRLLCGNCDSKFGAKKSYVSGEGICYQFKLNPAVRGPNLQLRGRDYVSIVVPEAEADIQPKSYWTLYVESGNGSMIPSIFETGSVVLNRSNLVTINRSTFSKLSTGSQPCVDEIGYSSSECQARCTIDYMLITMTCTLLLIGEERANISDYCNYYGSSTERFFDQKTINESIVTVRKCLDQCLPQCTNTVHQISVQVMDFEFEGGAPPPDYQAAQAILVDTSIRWQGILEYVESSTYSFDSLVGNVGGTLGLFLGATVFTLFQFVLTIVEYGVLKRAKIAAAS